MPERSWGAYFIFNYSSSNDVYMQKENDLEVDMTLIYHFYLIGYLVSLQGHTFGSN